MPKQYPYKRILLKLSGELLMGGQNFGIDQNACDKVANALIKLQQAGLEVAVVIGGGNIFRGIQLNMEGISRTPADQMGMLATLMNGVALQQALEARGCDSKVMTALECPKVAESFNYRNAIQALNLGTLLIFVGGTGNPYFTTDTAAALRGAEINADILLKATKVDGIYDKDPLKNSDAKKYDHISYARVLAEKLAVMDATAISLCQYNGLPILVFNMQRLFTDDPYRQILPPQSQGTLVDANQ
ncbi:MAG: UMP kinase [Parachlamydiaceae bacterium]|nr:UMP kinase [Parachlamydiaceae bacterium]